MRVTIEKILLLENSLEPGKEIAYTENGLALVDKGTFKKGDLVLYFDDQQIKHINDFEILQERFMQEGDDVTHFLE